MGANKENQQNAMKGAQKAQDQARAATGSIGFEPVSAGFQGGPTPRKDAISAIAPGVQGAAPQAMPTTMPDGGGMMASGGPTGMGMDDPSKHQEKVAASDQGQSFWGDMSGAEKVALGASIGGSVMQALKPPTPSPPAPRQGSYQFRGAVADQLMGPRQRRPSFRDIYGG